MPLPRGRKSRPTMFSSTDDLPADWDPTTTWRAQTESAKTRRKARGMPQWRRGYCTYNLREIQGVVADCIEYEILQLVDDRQQVVAEGSHGSGCAMCDWPKRWSMLSQGREMRRGRSKGGLLARKITTAALVVARAEGQRGAKQRRAGRRAKEGAADAWSWLLMKRLAAKGVRLFGAG